MSFQSVFREADAPIRTTTTSRASRISHAWVSMPTASEAGGYATAKTITVEELKKGSGKAIVLDIGEREAFKRSHWPGAVNIPADELQIRGGRELPRDGTIVIDRTQEQNFRCAAASSLLLEQAFPSVLVMVR
jgi:rhodanese-related sulfurtransferase